MHFWCIFLDKEKAYKIENQYLVGFILRRERDSNPRYLSVRRFSRPVQSTTLPPLQRCFCVKECGLSVLTLQKYIKNLNCASVLAKKLKIFFLFCVFVGFCPVFVSFFMSFLLFANRMWGISFIILLICYELFLRIN